MPEIVEGIAAAERMSDRDKDASVLADQYAVGAGVNFAGRPTALAEPGVYYFRSALGRSYEGLF